MLEQVITGVNRFFARLIKNDSLYGIIAAIYYGISPEDIIGAKPTQKVGGILANCQGELRSVIGSLSAAKISALAAVVHEMRSRLVVVEGLGPKGVRPSYSFSGYDQVLKSLTDNFGKLNIKKLSSLSYVRAMFEVSPVVILKGMHEYIFGMEDVHQLYGNRRHFFAERFSRLAQTSLVTAYMKHDRLLKVVDPAFAWHSRVNLPINSR